MCYFYCVSIAVNHSVIKTVLSVYNVILLLPLYVSIAVNHSVHKTVLSVYNVMLLLPLYVSIAVNHSVNKTATKAFFNPDVVSSKRVMQAFNLGAMLTDDVMKSVCGCGYLGYTANDCFCRSVASVVPRWTMSKQTYARRIERHWWYLLLLPSHTQSWTWLLCSMEVVAWVFSVS